jgi:1,4-dihydroxy-2-naphthoate octaprenyltransferase
VSPPLKLWVAGARPRTLPAAIVPVAVGTAAGYLSSGRFVLTTPRVSSACHATACNNFDRQVSWLNAILALVVALGIQVGTNYVNDYADGVRGTDEHRLGPVRLVAGRLATVREVKIAALFSFAVAGLAGLLLAARVTWWLIPLGLLCGIAGWAYTGGPRPYGYFGFGEFFVFVFFGLVATAGSAYVQHAPFVISLGGHLFPPYGYDWGFVLWAGVPIGLLAAALLEANNLRDITTDTQSGKKTLAVRLGRRRAGLLYCFTLMGVALSIGVLHGYRAWSLLALAGIPLAIAPVRLALGDGSGRDLLPMLGATARLQIVVGLLLTVGLLI